MSFCIWIKTIFCCLCVSFFSWSITDASLHCIHPRLRTLVANYTTVASYKESCGDCKSLHMRMTGGDIGECIQQYFICSWAWNIQLTYDSALRNDSSTLKKWTENEHTVKPMQDFIIYPKIKLELLILSLRKSYKRQCIISPASRSYDSMTSCRLHRKLKTTCSDSLNALASTNYLNKLQ